MFLKIGEESSGRIAVVGLKLLSELPGHADGVFRANVGKNLQSGEDAVWRFEKHGRFARIKSDFKGLPSFAFFYWQKPVKTKGVAR